MYFDILQKVMNRKNKRCNVVFHQHIYKWNKHTEILPPIICYENQNRTRDSTILLYQLLMDTVYDINANIMTCTEGGHPVCLLSRQFIKYVAKCIIYSKQ